MQILIKHFQLLKCFGSLKIVTCNDWIFYFLAVPVPVPPASSSSTPLRRDQGSTPAGWTPGQGSSPSKTPVNVTDVTPEHHPGSIRRSSSVASDKDKTFEGMNIKIPIFLFLKNYDLLKFSTALTHGIVFYVLQFNDSKFMLFSNLWK